MTAFTPPCLLLSAGTCNQSVPLEGSSAAFCACTINAVAEVEERREYGLDSTLAETFPCSDPLSSLPNPHPPTS